nr:HAD family hydrolase [Nocardiopsis dassonvillei]
MSSKSAVLVALTIQCGLYCNERERVRAFATSGQWGVAKPDPAFFTKVLELAPGRPEEIVYVGDHRDNDVVPAKAAGLCTVLIRRGPWGHLWADDPVARESADWTIDDLTELPELLLSFAGCG